LLCNNQVVISHTSLRAIAWQSIVIANLACARRGNLSRIISLFGGNYHDQKINSHQQILL
ncbi:MAG TPA: hypothetical protein VKR58_12035, partial [Aquella sp.]|nr:hypothetical protein [Aquella sp.]